MKKVAIVILNWNGRSMLERFLPSVTACSGGAEVVVADNGSTDDSVAFLSQQYPQLRLIQFDRNYGFAEGTTGPWPRWRLTTTCSSTATWSARRGGSSRWWR